MIGIRYYDRIHHRTFCVACLPKTRRHMFSVHSQLRKAVKTDFLQIISLVINAKKKHKNSFLLFLYLRGPAATWLTQALSEVITKTTIIFINLQNPDMKSLFKISICMKNSRAGHDGMLRYWLHGSHQRTQSSFGYKSNSLYNAT